MSMYENSGTSTLLSWDIPPWSVCMSRHACLAITLHTWHGHDCCTHVQPSSDRGTFPHWTHLYSIKTRTAAKKYLWSQWCVSDVKSSIFSQLSEVFFWKCAITIMLQCVWETGYTEYRTICKQRRGLHKHISSTLNEWMDETEGENLIVSFYSTHLCLKKSSYSLKNQQQSIHINSPPIITPCPFFDLGCNTSRRPLRGRRWVGETLQSQAYRPCLGPGLS